MNFVDNFREVQNIENIAKYRKTWYSLWGGGLSASTEPHVAYPVGEVGRDDRASPCAFHVGSAAKERGWKKEFPKVTAEPSLNVTMRSSCAAHRVVNCACGEVKIRS